MKAIAIKIKLRLKLIFMFLGVTFIFSVNVYDKTYAFLINPIDYEYKLPIYTIDKKNINSPTILTLEQNGGSNIALFTDLAIYKGYSVSQIREELELRDKIVSSLSLYYGKNMIRWDAEDEEIISSWTNFIRGGLKNGPLPLEIVKRALERAGKGEPLDETDNLVFSMKYVGQGNFGTYYSQLLDLQKRYNFNMSEVLSNKLKVLYNFGTWQRDPLIFKGEGISYSFDYLNTFAGNFSLLKLEYDVNTSDAGAMNGFYVQLPEQDLSKQKRFVFFVKGGERQGPPSISLPFVRQDPNAGYTEQFRIEFEDNQGNKARYMVNGIRQDQWLPVVIEKEKMEDFAKVDWRNVRKINIIFSDSYTFPDKDGKIYICGLVENPKRQTFTSVVNDIKHFLEKFYSESPEDKIKDLRRLGIEGLPYISMDSRYIESIAQSLESEPSNIFNSGIDLLLENILPNANTALTDLIEDILIPGILQGKITPQNIKSGIKISLAEFTRVARNKLTPLFPNENISLSDIPTIENYRDILINAIKGQTDALAITKIAEINGVRLYGANFFADETLRTGIIPNLGINRYIIPYTNAENTIPAKVPFIAVIQSGDRTEYVVVTDVYKNPAFGRFSPLYVEYVNNTGNLSFEIWDRFRDKWREGGGLGMVTVPVLVKVKNKPYEFVLLKKVAGNREEDKVIYSTPGGEEICTRGEFAKIFDGKILNPVRPYGEFMDINYPLLQQRALQMAREKTPIVEPKPVPELDPPIGGDVATTGLNYTEYEAIGGDVVFQDKEGWIEARPRGNVHKDPINLYIYNDILNRYGLIKYVPTQYDYIDPMITPPIDIEKLPVEGQYISSTKIGHKMGGGRFPEIINLSGNGYVRFTGFPPLIMGASLRFGFHNVGGKEIGNTDKEDFYKITDMYIKKINESQYNILLLINALDYTGTLDIKLTPGEESIMEVKATYYPKRDLDMRKEPNTGFLGFSSMFWKGITDTPSVSDDQAHDSDYLTVIFNDGSKIERYLQNPKKPTITDFRTGGKIIKGFLLEQRDRDPNHYKTYPGDEFHNRSSYEVNIIKASAPLTVKLYEFPTNERFMDNIVVFMAPLTDILKAQTPFVLEYLVKAKK